MSTRPESPDLKGTIPLLQKIQTHLGYIPSRAISWLAEKLDLSEQEIYGVATFYKSFRFVPPGRHKIEVCLGTACHVQGGSNLMKAIEKKLGIEAGETTPSGSCSLDRVACVGACALAPNLVIDGEPHGRIAQRSMKRFLDEICGKETEARSE